MASQINKYAQNIARARYATPSYTAPQRRATIDPSLFSGKKAAAGAPLASRPIEGGPALPSPQQYNPITDAESGEDPNAPRVETQQPIAQPAIDPRFIIQGNGPRIDLSGFFPERTNANYDPSKAIGGENVPYKPAGFFRSILGDPANRKNIEAQQAQGAEWRQSAKEQEVEDRLLKRITAQNEPLQKRFETEMEFRKGEAADAKANREAQLALEKQRLDESKADRTARLQLQRQEALDRVTQQQFENDAATQRLALGKSQLDQPHFGSLGQNAAYSYDPRTQQYRVLTAGTPRMGEMFPGTEPSLRNIPSPFVSKGGADSQVSVNPLTGEPLGGGTTLSPGGGVLKPGGTAAPMTPPRSMPSPMAGKELTEQFKSAMPSLDVERKAGPGFTNPFLSEGELAQQAMSQIAYPLRAAVGQQVKGQYANPEAAAMTMESPRPFMRFKRPSAEEQQQALSVADLIRKMYAE